LKGFVVMVILMGIKFALEDQARSVHEQTIDNGFLKNSIGI
jgi:hypothetical protein